MSSAGLVSGARDASAAPSVAEPTGASTVLLADCVAAEADADADADNEASGDMIGSEGLCPALETAALGPPTASDGDLDAASVAPTAASSARLSGVSVSKGLGNATKDD
jgi:hypothetical protein